MNRGIAIITGKKYVLLSLSIYKIHIDFARH